MNDNNLDNNSNNINHHAGHPNGKHQMAANPTNVGYTNRCLPGWVWYNNKCWLVTQSRRDFAHAIDLCKKAYNSSTLPTIHSEEENEVLRQKIDLQNSPIWLYARHNHQYNQTRWLDRSPVNFTNWDRGQPSDKASLVCIKTEDSWYMRKAESSNGQTECISFWEDAKWGTQVGCTVLLPVVCEKKLAPLVRYHNGGQNMSEQLIEQAPIVNNGLGSIPQIIGFNSIVSSCLVAILISYLNHQVGWRWCSSNTDA